MPGTWESGSHPARTAVSQPSEPSPPPFSHGPTLKSIFAEPRAAADLIAFLAERECPAMAVRNLSSAGKASVPSNSLGSVRAA